MVAKELREKSISDLYKNLAGFVGDYTKSKLNIKLGNTSEIKNKRSLKKQIAQIKTIISEKKVLSEYNSK